MRDKALQYFTTSGITLISACIISSCSTTNNATKPLVSSGTAPSSRTSLANTQLALAQTYEQAGNTKKALSTYASVSKKNPFSAEAAEASFSQARILDSQSETSKAFDAYQELIKRHPSSKYYGKALKRQEEIAHSTADGVIRNNFLGLKTKIPTSKIVDMLGHVRDNAPSAPSASRAQYTIGQLLHQDDNYVAATEAYQKMAVDYPSSKEAPEALYQRGEILVLRAEKGNQNKANINSARDTYNNLIDRYPNHPRAKDARARISSLGGQAIQRKYDTAEFYRKKGQNTSALFYYNQVRRETKSGALHDLAKQRAAELSGSSL
ncbi:outer membrane protein assembly factor BamD [Akkermansiaceae bacterium]|nr:outer membrane protein assembly factor BamD [Akkermansiaceae bacterium]